jgi:membrane-associated HD superfamily phosphohydrolase
MAAADADEDGPTEMEYRYPGPKPRTKEAAILMLCDAVEGATRAMSEPTPSRISALVHDMAMARMHDGQFDESELTFAELNLIEDAVTKALCSIYHGRIAYPGEAKRQPSREQPEALPPKVGAPSGAGGERRQA